MKPVRTLQNSVLLFTAFAAVVLMAERAWGIGFVLGESKEELKLKYDVAVTDHGTGRVTIVFTLADEGRLKPLDEVQLVVPDQEKNKDGSYGMDLVVSIKLYDRDDGKRVGRIHLLRELAERAQIRLNTHTMDGKLDPRTRLHHVIPIAKYLDDAAKPADKAAADRPEKPSAPPAAERKNN